jgi:ABC-type polysaccharide/polyol phosphate export permease
MDGFRSTLYSTEFMGLSEWMFLALVTALSLVVGSLIYMKSRDRFLYHI